MSEIAYISKVKIEHIAVPNNMAILPPDNEEVLFGVHGEIASHYKLVSGTFEPHAATLDYIIASAGGCLTGTFGGALAGRGVLLGVEGLTADVTGEIEKEDEESCAGLQRKF